jgi:hypothetical protein
MGIHFKNNRSRQKHKSGSRKQHQDYHIRLIEYFSSGDDLDGGGAPAAGGAGVGGQTGVRQWADEQVPEPKRWPRADGEGSQGGGHHR